MEDQTKLSKYNQLKKFINKSTTYQSNPYNITDIEGTFAQTYVNDYKNFSLVSPEDSLYSITHTMEEEKKDNGQRDTRHSCFSEYPYFRMLKKQRKGLINFINKDKLENVKLIGNNRYINESPKKFISDSKKLLPDKKKGLLPVPLLRKKLKIENNDSKDYYELQRGIVNLRRMQYDRMLRKKDRLDEIIFIQKWWRKYLYNLKFKKIIMIQRNFLGFLIRKKFKVLQKLCENFTEIKRAINEVFYKYPFKKIKNIPYTKKPRNNKKFFCYTKTKDMISDSMKSKIVTIQNNYRVHLAKILLRKKIKISKLINKKIKINKFTKIVVDKNLLNTKINLIQKKVREFLRRQKIKNKKVFKLEKVPQLYIDKIYLKDYYMRIIEFNEKLKYTLQMMIFRRRNKYKKMRRYNIDDINEIIKIQKAYKLHYRKLHYFKKKDINSICYITKYSNQKAKKMIIFLQNKFRQLLQIIRFKNNIVKNKPSSKNYNKVKMNMSFNPETKVESGNILKLGKLEDKICENLSTIPINESNIIKEDNKMVSDIDINIIGEKNKNELKPITSSINNNINNQKEDNKIISDIDINIVGENNKNELIINEDVKEENITNSLINVVDKNINYNFVPYISKINIINVNDKLSLLQKAIKQFLYRIQIYKVNKLNFGKKFLVTKNIIDDKEYIDKIKKFQIFYKKRYNKLKNKLIENSQSARRIKKYIQQSHIIIEPKDTKNLFDESSNGESQDMKMCNSFYVKSHKRLLLRELIEQNKKPLIDNIAGYCQKIRITSELYEVLKLIRNKYYVKPNTQEGNFISKLRYKNNITDIKLIQKKTKNLQNLKKIEKNMKIYQKPPHRNYKNKKEEKDSSNEIKIENGNKTEDSYFEEEQKEFSNMVGEKIYTVYNKNKIICQPYLLMNNYYMITKERRVNKEQHNLPTEKEYDNIKKDLKKRRHQIIQKKNNGDNLIEEQHSLTQKSGSIKRNLNYKEINNFINDPKTEKSKQSNNGNNKINDSLHNDNIINSNSILDDKKLHDTLSKMKRIHKMYSLNSKKSSPESETSNIIHKTKTFDININTKIQYFKNKSNYIYFIKLFNLFVTKSTQQFIFGKFLQILSGGTKNLEKNFNLPFYITTLKRLFNYCKNDNKKNNKIVEFIQVVFPTLKKNESYYYHLICLTLENHKKLINKNLYDVKTETEDLYQFYEDFVGYEKIIQLDKEYILNKISNTTFNNTNIFTLIKFIDDNFKAKFDVKKNEIDKTISSINSIDSFESELNFDLNRDTMLNKGKIKINYFVHETLMDEDKNK